jgi:hypothetical protein
MESARFDSSGASGRAGTGFGAAATLVQDSAFRLGWAIEANRTLLLLFGLAIVPIFVADTLSNQVSTAMLGQCPREIARIQEQTFLPRIAILSATVFLTLLAWGRHVLARSTDRPAPPHAPVPAPDDWLDFPEAPLLRLRAGDVTLIRSAGNYSEIVCGERTHLVRVPLGELTRRLAWRGFVRVHRQTVINAAHVRTICRDVSGRVLIRLIGGEAVPVGRRYTDTIDALTR